VGSDLRGVQVGDLLASWCFSAVDRSVSTIIRFMMSACMSFVFDMSGR
jgi:hypothetical protein